jgi:transcriptional regulator with XRE-family HTH domain
MEEKIGEIIKKVALAQGLSQAELGKLINLTKQGVASIYKRSTIDIELLKEISAKLNHDFLSYYLREEPFKTFQEIQTRNWIEEIEKLKAELQMKDELIEKDREILNLQRKYIAELEKK